MADVMMRLGSFDFGLSTAAYQEFQRSTAYTWADLKRFGKDDALQYTGNGEDSITLPGIVYPEFRGGTGQLDDLRALAELAEPQLLIDGRGTILGEWVIQSVDERGSIFAAAGVARKQEFTLKLRRFQDDGSADAGSLIPVSPGVLPTTSLLSSAQAVTITASSAPTSILSSLSGSITDIASKAAVIGSSSSAIMSNVQAAINAGTRLKNAGADAAQLLRTGRIIGNIPSAMASLTNIAGATSRAAGFSSDLLSTAAQQLSAAGVETSAVLAVRTAMINVNQLAVLASSIRNSAVSVTGRI